MMKFRERFMMGEVPFDDIFSLTDKWNFSDEACTLREYLGLTAKEEDVVRIRTGETGIAALTGPDEE